MTPPTPAAPKRRERDIQREILRLLHARGVVAWKAGSGAFRVGDRYVRMGHKGVADIIGVVSTPIVVDAGLCGVGGCLNHVRRFLPRGGFLAIEVKRPGMGTTPEQSAFLRSVRAVGGIAFVARSCEDVCRELGWT